VRVQGAEALGAGRLAGAGCLRRAPAAGGEGGAAALRWAAAGPVISRRAC
jgi:hypothetical protein